VLPASVLVFIVSISLLRKILSARQNYIYGIVALALYFP